MRVSIRASMTDKYSVLIVDDSFADRFLLKRMLSMTGLELTLLEASDGQAALDILTRPLSDLKLQYSEINAPLIVFLDINMPLMNGWEFLQELQHQDKAVQLKPSIVIMYTTSDSVHERKKAQSYARVMDYMTKDEPTPEKLKKAILSCHIP